MVRLRQMFRGHGVQDAIYEPAGLFRAVLLGQFDRFVDGNRRRYVEKGDEFAGAQPENAVVDAGHSVPVPVPHHRVDVTVHGLFMLAEPIDQSLGKTPGVT